MTATRSDIFVDRQRVVIVFEQHKRFDRGVTCGLEKFGFFERRLFEILVDEWMIEQPETKLYPQNITDGIVDRLHRDLAALYEVARRTGCTFG